MKLFRPTNAAEEFRQCGAFLLLLGVLSGIVWFFFPDKASDSMIPVACFGFSAMGLFGLIA
jgi:hypothetical protein